MPSRAVDSEVHVARFPRIVPQIGGVDEERISDDFGHIQALRGSIGL